MWGLIVKGGPLMFLIILCSVIALAVVLERLLQLYRSRINTEEFMEDISGTLRRNKIMEAIDKCNATPGPIAQILKAGILKHDRSRLEIKEAIEDAGVHEVPRLEKNLGVLATIAHISPLLGLIGTVTGMEHSLKVNEQKAVSLGSAYYDRSGSGGSDTDLRGLQLSCKQGGRICAGNGKKRYGSCQHIRGKKGRR